MAFALTAAPPGSTALAAPYPVPAAHRRGPQLPRHYVPDAGRGMGTLVLSTKGTGKSRLTGRALTFQDVVRGIPTIVLDPLGGTIDNLLDKLTRLPKDLQERIWPRVRYVNMAGQAGRIIPWPVYHQAAPGEDLYAISQRYVDVIRRADPHLATASIQGMNRLEPLATAAGMVLAALGLSITEAEGLIANPKAWEPLLREARRRSPEVAPAVEVLTELGQLDPRERDTRTEPLRNKLALFRFDPTTRAMFGTTTPGISWPEVDARRLCVLVDFRDERDLSRMQFKLLWVFYSLLDYIKRRGLSHSQRPLSFVVDEFSYLAGRGNLNTDVLTADLEELINRLARNKRVWLTIASQEQYQLPESMLNTLLSMGNQIFGSTSNPEAAERLARRYIRYDPYKIKKYELNANSTTSYSRQGPPHFLGTSVEFTMEEQEYLGAQHFLNLPRFHFLVATSPTEGTLPTSLHRLSTAGLDPGEYPDDVLVNRARSLLMQRHGIPIEAALAQIESRRPAPDGHASTTVRRSVSIPRPPSPTPALHDGERHPPPPPRPPAPVGAAPRPPTTRTATPGAGRRPRP